MAFDMTAAKERLSSALDCAAAEFKPNTVVSVFKDGAPVLRKSYGTAKETDRFVMTLECDIFLSLMALLLIERKKLRFSDKLSRYIPEYKHAGEITVRNLMDKKTGIRDFFYGEIMRRMDKTDSGISDEERRLRDTAASAKYYSIEEVLALVGEAELEAKPGTEEQWGYGDRTLPANRNRARRGQKPLGICRRKHFPSPRHEKHPPRRRKYRIQRNFPQ